MSKDHHIKVTFLGDGFTFAERGTILLAFEKLTRERTGKPAEVFLDRMGDDSKLRTKMTPEQRKAL